MLLHLRGIFKHKTCTHLHFGATPFPTIIFTNQSHNMDSTPIYHRVQDRYGELADRYSTNEDKEAEKNIAQAFGYDSADLSSIPQTANLGVSCGNPLALANLREVR